jgi:hypothetical protein
MLLEELYFTGDTIEFTKHAREKMYSRRVSEADVALTVSNPDRFFADLESGAHVAIKQIMDKQLVVIFAKEGLVTRVITVYRSTYVDSLIRNKVQRGAWLEK